MIEPDPGFGEKKISDVGIANVGAVAGNDSQQMFIDKAGHLWHVSAEGIQDLDYHEYFEDMTAPIIVSFNEHDKDFYFSDGADCYLYHKGLSKTWQTVMSCFYDKGNVVGIYREIDDTVDTYP